MSVEKSLSESAQWFLRDFQKLLDDFAVEEDVWIVAIDKKENLVTESPGVQRVFKLIMATEEGKIRYRDNYKMAFTLIKTQGKTIFSDDFAGFASAWLPISVRGSLIGLMIISGGRYDRGEIREKLREKYSKLADELGIVDKEDFIKAAIEEVKIVDEEEMEKKAGKLKKLIEVLLETTQTPLKEVFG